MAESFQTMDESTRQAYNEMTEFLAGLKRYADDFLCSLTGADIKAS